MNQIPKHIGFIMDGNRRWAKSNGVSVAEGHDAGAQNLSRLIQHCAKKGVETITVYALSTENLKKRSAKELADIFSILFSWMKRERSRLIEQGVKVAFLGQLKRLPQKVQTGMQELMSSVKHNERVKLNVMVGYGGRTEILDAVKELMQEGISASDLNEELISKHLYTKDSPDPDLIIRTGGDKRISNFLIWQMSYAELYFSDKFWPEFNEVELDKALEDYANRSRRYGGQDAKLTTQSA